MKGPDFTLAQLRHCCAGTPQGAGIDYLLAQDHPARVKAVQTSIDFACNQLEQHKHKKQGKEGKGLSEDELTIQVCEMLHMAGFQAEHDTDVGGHCDIVIKGKDSFLWLAEAKKHDAYDWLEKGFQQLSTRYSTGVEGQDHGEVLIFCFTANAKNALAKWRDHLHSKNPCVRASPCAEGNKLEFHSVHEHEASGLDFHIRHKAVALHWKPKDS